MPWRTISAVQIAGRMTDAEQKMLAAVAGPNQHPADKLAERLTDATNEFLGALRARDSATFSQAKAGTVPDQLRRHVVARAVWDWLNDFPSLKQFKTDERKAASALADDALQRIEAGTYGAVESPVGPSGPNAGGNWNSRAKILGRMHPLPQPDTQWQSGGLAGSGYSNPNAEEDTADSDAPGKPDEPKHLEALALDGKVQLTWDLASNAATYTVLRGTAAGQEDAGIPLVSGLTDANYTDATAVNGTKYFYKVFAVGADPALLQSGFSNEASATPQAV